MIMRLGYESDNRLITAAVCRLCHTATRTDQHLTRCMKLLLPCTIDDRRWRQCRTRPVGNHDPLQFVAMSVSE